MEILINETTRNVNKRLFNDNSMNIDFKYGVIDTTRMKEYLSFIYEWNGLTSSAKIPSTYKDYETKARNWLNGRRSTKYSNNLFFDMIHSALNV